MNENNNEMDTTQPSAPLQKSKSGRVILFGALGLIIFLGIAVLGGYRSGIAIRQQARSEIITGQISEQFQNAIVDMEFGRYDLAQQRLEWIIDNDPSFPGAQEKLTEVLVKINLEGSYVAPTVTASVTPTPDFSGVQEAFSRAQQQIAASDWVGALGTLDQLRKTDPNYQTSLVDGMYHFALRNYGYDLIVNEGNLEGGIYQLTLAEHFGPLDVNANGIREGSRYYILGASFWDVNWEQAVFYFTQVGGGWPGLWDGTMTASERLYIASMRYGDQLFIKNQFCDAVVQYENAQRISPLDKLAKENYDDALIGCFPATPTLDPSLLFTPTVDPSLSPTVGVPTETLPPPPPTPTDTPPTP